MSWVMLRKAVAGLLISLGITLLILWLINMPLTTLLTIPHHLLLLALSLCIIRLLAQGLRFHLLVKRHSSVQMGFGESFIVRGVSEFFALTTIPFFADEAVRVWILREHGEKTVAAFWVSFIELILDVVVSAPIALLAGVTALTRGELYLTAILITIPSAQLLLTAIIVLLPELHGLRPISTLIDTLSRRVPILVRPLDLLKRSGKESIIFMENIRKRWSAAFLLSLLALTVAVMTLPALTLYLVYSGYNPVGLVQALFAFHAGNTLGVLPVTVGGSGLTEAGVYLYSSRVLGAASWKPAMLWRILTYHLTLLLCGLMLIIYTLKRRVKTPPESSTRR